MKRCPKCGKTYHGSWPFCLLDQTALVDDSAEPPAGEARPTRSDAEPGAQPAAAKPVEAKHEEGLPKPTEAGRDVVKPVKEVKPETTRPLDGAQVAKEAKAEGARPAGEARLGEDVTIVDDTIVDDTQLTEEWKAPKPTRDAGDA